MSTTTEPPVAAENKENFSEESPADGRNGAADIEYPTGLKLGMITLALCLAIFLVALVSYGQAKSRSILIYHRITPSLPLLSLVLPTSLTP
jgi:hypothetical protein